MKKSTILILFIVFFGSVLIVGVFGMQAVPFEQWIYVKQIQPTGIYTSTGEKLELKQNSRGEYVVVTYEENLTVLVTTKVLPENSTNRELKITLVDNPEDDPLAKVGEKGEIIILKPGIVTVRYTSKDSATGPSWMFRIITTEPIDSED